MWLVLEAIPIDWTNLGLAGAVAAAFAAGWIVAKPSVDAMKRQYEERLSDKDKQLAEKDAIIRRQEALIEAANIARIAALERQQGVEAQLRAIHNRIDELLQ